MAKTKISEFSSTPANNTDIDSINIAEGCAPSNINDAIRELMAQLKDFQTGAVGDSFNGPIGSSTASTGAFTNITASGTLGVTGVATLGAGAILNTPASVTLTNATGLPISTGVSGLGTGVATALAVNVGSAGAPVVNGGALGTPSSGTVTNLTGTASININGTVGATTPTTGAFTTLAASGSVTLSGGTANGVTYLNGSKVLTSGSALTFDGTNLGVANTSGSDVTLLTLTSNSGIRQQFNPTNSTGTKYNWRIDVNGLVDQTWSLIPSTAVGGSTFSTPVYQAHGNGTQIWSVGSSEAMRLNGTGLGIGTSSPGSKLSIAVSTTAANADIELGNSAGVKNYVFTGGSTNATTRWRNNLVLYTGGAQDILFETNAAERMRLDSAGNLGLGVTPSAWNSSQWSVFEGAYGGALAFYKASNVPVTVLTSNAYNDGGWKYKTTDPALQYEMDGNVGIHKWYTAPSGTAGDAISFTQAATLTADGNYLLGTTTDVSTVRMQVWSSSSNNTAYFRNSNATPYGPSVKYTAATPNNTGSEFLFCEDSTALRVSLRSNGGIANYSANDVNLSDERTKTNIQDAGSYLAKICAIPVRTFKYKDQSDDLLNLGVIAQEVEAVAPELVDATGFGETPKDGIPLKAVYQTDMQYALMKALQELKMEFDAYKATHP